jgi:hypothetical protein
MASIQGERGWRGALRGRLTQDGERVIRGAEHVTITSPLTTTPFAKPTLPTSTSPHIHTSFSHRLVCHAHWVLTHWMQCWVHCFESRASLSPSPVLHQDLVNMDHHNFVTQLQDMHRLDIPPLLLAGRAKVGRWMGWVRWMGG